MRTDRDLLDHLGECLDCVYLSDLRPLRLRPDLIRAVRAVPAERYSAAQWADALYYLTGVRQAQSATAQALKGELLLRLRRGGPGAV